MQHVRRGQYLVSASHCDLYDEMKQPLATSDIPSALLLSIERTRLGRHVTVLVRYPATTGLVLWQRNSTLEL